MIGFEVLGVPAPQGSKVRTKHGMREDNPATEPWRQVIAYKARQVMGGTEMFVGPVVLTLIFVMKRPKGHWGTGQNAGVLKQTAPHWHSVAPDLDKLVRAVCDGLTAGGVWKDDSLVVSVAAGKRYTVADEVPRALIRIEAA